ncbi:MAG: acetyl-CoA carboxylase biotin carboxyl carrier protein subunit [Desulfovibrionaceae bacterium]|nr:acetyl-CoA carboxylase biotin carboxyl carrier protein subunit [Desulfovibrionaceae bacterium]
MDNRPRKTGRGKNPAHTYSQDEDNMPRDEKQAKTPEGLMDASRIEELIGIALKWDLDSLEVEDGRGRVRIVRRGAVVAAGPAAGSVAPASAAETSAAGASGGRDCGQRAGAHTVTSQLVGTFRPGAREDGRVLAPVGALVEPGQALGFVEAMKMYTEIASDASGRVAEVLAAEGQPVQYGDPLFIIEPIGS